MDISEEKKKKASAKQRYKLSVILALIALVSVVAASVAWFSIADFTKVNSMSMDVSSVKGGSTKYYSWNGSSWEEKSEKTPAVPAFAKSFQTGSLDCILSTDGTIENAISLAGVRSLVKSSSEGTSTFTVEAEITATIPESEISIIPEASLQGNEPEQYAKLNYVSQLSVQKNSLNYSSMKARFTETFVKYYRDKGAKAKLTYDADSIGSLGINVFDLTDMHLDPTNTYSLIDTTAIYGFNTKKDMEETLNQADSVKFTLTLKRKSKTSTEIYETQNIDSTNPVLRVSIDGKEIELNDNSFTWTVGKAMFESATLSLTQAIELWVNVKVQDNQFFYSNYQVELTAVALDSKNNIITNTQSTDHVIYTLARIRPELQ